MTRSYIVDDPVKQRFLLDREALVSQSVLADEMARIFSKCWIYVGHSSELKKPNDFITRKVASRPVIFIRDGRGDIRCFFNTCRHRGAMVCTEPQGSRRSFRCVYHGWTYRNDGALAGFPAPKPIAGISTRRTSGSEAPRASSRIAISGFSISPPMRRPSVTISAARPTTSISSSINRRRAIWRSSPARRNTTSPPTGS